MTIETEFKSRFPIQPTICRDCIFAEWDKNVQIGCQLGRTEAFEENGAEVRSVDDDNDSGFIIDRGQKIYDRIDRFCNACRNAEWGRKHPRRKWKQLVTDRIKIQYDLIIRVDNNHSVMNIMDTFRSGFEQNPKPSKTIINVTEQYEVKPLIRALRNEKVGPWIIEHVPFETIHRYTNHIYYTVFNAGYIIPADYAETINRALNEKMIRFVAINPLDDDGNGLFIQNFGRSLTEINKLEEEQSIRMTRDYWEL